MPARFAVVLDGLEATVGPQQIGPLSLALPPPGGFDPSAPDLGLGVPVDELLELLRELAAHALLAWGDADALVVGALLGVHRQLPGLPSDWPLLQPPTPGDLGSLLTELPGALRAQLARLATGSAADGRAFAQIAAEWASALLAQALPAELDRAPSRSPPAPARSPIRGPCRSWQTLR